MFSLQFLATLSSAAFLVSAAPTLPKFCDTSVAVMDLPKNQTQLIAPTTAPIYVALGVGVQNYTCSASTLKYTSTGAVASLFDLSCIDRTPLFSTIQNNAFKLWSAAPPKLSPTTLGSAIGAPTLLGFHYFVPSPSTVGALSPKWDFTSTGHNAGNANAFVIGAKAGFVAAPKTATDVDWLALNNVQGSLAQKIFRIDTVGGQPPASCVAGSADISVKYTSKYYLY